jgi:ankyrin repeat protein
VPAKVSWQRITDEDDGRQPPARVTATLDNADAQGNTPLHSAVLNDQRVVAKYLINRGASLDIRNNAGKSPLAIAIERKNHGIERILRQFGASENR